LGLQLNSYCLLVFQLCELHINRVETLWQLHTLTVIHSWYSYDETKVYACISTTVNFHNMQFIFKCFITNRNVSDTKVQNQNFLR